VSIMAVCHMTGTWLVVFVIFQAFIAGIDQVIVF
jgi:hypothetical protein